MPGRAVKSKWHDVFIYLAFLFRTHSVPVVFRIQFRLVFLELQIYTESVILIAQLSATNLLVHLEAPTKCILEPGIIQWLSLRMYSVYSNRRFSWTLRLDSS